MNHISFIFEQNIHLLFLQILLVCLLNLFFFSKLRYKKLIFFSVFIACIISVIYIWINFYSNIVLWIFLILFNRKCLKSNSINFILNASLAVFLFIFSDYTVEILFQTIFKSMSISLSFRVLLNLAVSMIFAILMKKFLKRMTTDNNYEIFKQILCAFLLFTVVIYYVLITMNRFSIYSSIDFKVHAFLLLFYSCLSIALFSIALSTIRKQMQLKMRKTEIEQIISYTKQVEQSYMEMRKFRHDYRNILTSIEMYIEEGNMDRLAHYYETKIRPTKEKFATDFSHLSDLSQIKIPEIKSIISSKLLRAQAMGIETTFECREEIHELYMDSLVLVRSLGILLDNAIEEIEAIANKGKIEVACIHQEHSIQIIIRNSCRTTHMPQIYEMKQEGFSTKGTNRGLGLSNLEQLLSAFGHVSLDTQCANGQFTQIIEISKEEKYATRSYL